MFTLLCKVNKEMLILKLDTLNCSNWLSCGILFFCFCCHNRGYLSPEYASFGHISTAIDVYSFGIMVLEIVSGRKNLDFEKPSDQQILLQWVWINYLVSYNMGYWQTLYVTHVCVYVCNHEDDSTNNFHLMESIYFHVCEHNRYFSLQWSMWFWSWNNP